MSHYVKCKTHIKDRKTLITALERAGVPTKFIKISDNGKSIDLNGFINNSGITKAEVVVSKGYHNGYGDVGYVLDKDGTYLCVVDDMDDVGSLAKKAGVNSFTTSVNNWYGALKSQKALKMQGLDAKITSSGSKIVVLAKG